MNPAIKRLEKQASSTLISLLDDMFASCDDLFFDLASRAASNLEQNLYFDSMREIRKKTENCREEFKKGLEENFAELGKSSAKQSDQDSTIDSLSLVDDDDVELDVAVKTMSSRARVTAKKALYEFHSRIESLYPGHIEEEQNPLDPAPVVKLFLRASQPIGLEIKSRIILFKQYERYVVNRLPEIYLSANKLLEELGVKFIDERKATRSKASGQSGFANNTAGTGDDQGLLSGSEPHYMYANPALSELSQLLGRLRGSSGSYNSNPSFSHSPLFNTPNSGPKISSEELLSLLNTAEHELPVSSNNFDLRNYMRQILKLSENNNRKIGVDQIDEDVINLVAMFFDFVLDDHNIPDNLRALIGRLQMPVLKVALKDKTFFTNTEHPCRHFINELSRISIGIVNDDGDSHDLLEKMETWVQQIQNETENIEQAFGKATTELEKYATQIQKRADLVEKRTSETAQGQARKEVAKMKAQKAIQEAMDSKVLAKPVADFIVNLWQQVLYRTHLKEGDESPQWLANLQTMQDLIWCSQPHDDDKSIQRLMRIRGDLKQKIEHGLRHTTLNDTQINKLVEEIDAAIDKVAAATDSARPVIEIEQFQAEKETKLETLSKQKSWKQMTALERQQKQHDALTYEYIERADSVDIGSWLEFKVPASGTTIRCKLAAKLNGSDIYVFVNRLGFKTLEKPRKEFAFDLQRKRARLLKTGPLFDRSLHKMVSSLKSAN